ncbi:hypothetical protein K440DRAFT_639515 [Wilcoxina mikolae CBS 423.85]|nr:hypothetical protein K440DRAFT_639515 [Wilcoxina mikolae CBS 423.85]
MFRQTRLVDPEFMKHAFILMISCAPLLPGLEHNRVDELISRFLETAFPKSKSPDLGDIRETSYAPHLFNYQYGLKNFEALQTTWMFAAKALGGRQADKDKRTKTSGQRDKQPLAGVCIEQTFCAENGPDPNIPITSGSNPSFFPHHLHTSNTITDDENGSYPPHC